VHELRGMNVTPHVSQNLKRSGGSAIDGRTTRHEGYPGASANGSELKKYRLDEDGRQPPQDSPRGLETVAWIFTFTAAAYNLVRMRNLMALAVRSSKSGPKCVLTAPNWASGARTPLTRAVSQANLPSLRGGNEKEPDLGRGHFSAAC